MSALDDLLQEEADKQQGGLPQLPPTGGGSLLDLLLQAGRTPKPEKYNPFWETLAAENIPGYGVGAVLPPSLAPTPDLADREPEEGPLKWSKPGVNVAPTPGPAPNPKSTVSPKPTAPLGSMPTGAPKSIFSSEEGLMREPEPGLNLGAPAKTPELSPGPITPPVKFEAPPAPQEVDIKGELEKMMAGVPRTAEELVGKPRVNVARGYTSTVSPLQGMLLNFAAGPGVVQGQLDKMQEQYTQQFKEDIEVAKSRLDLQTKMQLKKMDYDIQKSNEAKAKYDQMADQMAQSNPGIVHTSQWLQMKGRGMGMTPDQTQAWVQKNTDPVTGQTNLFQTPEEREYESKKAAIERLVRGGYMTQPQATALIIGGKYMTTFEAMKGDLEKQWGDAPKGPTGDKARAAIENQIREIQNIGEGITKGDMDKFAAIEPYLPKDLAKTIRENVTLMYLFRQNPAALKAIIAERSKQLDRETQRQTAIETTKMHIAANQEKIQQPNAEAVKQGVTKKILSTPEGIVAADNNPTYFQMADDKDVRAQFSGEVAQSKALMNKVDTILRQQTTVQNNPKIKIKVGTLTSEEKTLLVDYFEKQKRAIRNKGFGQVADELDKYTPEEGSIKANEILRKIGKSGF